MGSKKGTKKIHIVVQALGTSQLTFNELLERTENTPRYLRYMITKLKSIRLVFGKKTERGYAHASYEGYSSQIQSIFLNPIRNLLR
jgi:hypothetical protein